MLVSVSVFSAPFFFAKKYQNLLEMAKYNFFHYFFVQICVTKASLSGSFTRMSCTFIRASCQESCTFCMKQRGERRK